MLVTAVAVASCGGPPSLGDLKALPEFGLAPPAAIHVGRNEREAEQTVEGPVPAIAGDVFATALAPEGIFDFYDTELTARGYIRDDRDLANIRTTIENEVHVWRKGDVIARVAVLRVGDLRVPPVPTELPDSTLFELAFIARESEAVTSS